VTTATTTGTALAKTRGFEALEFVPATAIGLARKTSKRGIA